MKKKFLAVTLILVMLIAASIGTWTIKKDAAVYQNVLRLHVLADSDSAEDQALKLKVRDAILTKTQAILGECQTAKDAENVIAAHIDTLCRIANETLKQEGSDQTATISIVTEHYPTKNYASFRLPSGTYRSVKVEIGEAQGQNWWCVLFPSLCLSASAAEAEESFIDAGFSPDQVHVLTETEEKPYVIRFRILEWIGSIFS